MDGFKKIGPLMALGTALLWGFTSFTTTILSLIAIAAGALLYVVVIRAADFHRMLSVNVLMSGDAVFDDYDHNYPKYFMLEKARIERALGNYAVAAPIHLGSSSIPGLVGTPLLDAGVAESISDSRRRTEVTQGYRILADWHGAAQRRGRLPLDKRIPDGRALRQGTRHGPPCRYRQSTPMARQHGGLHGVPLLQRRRTGLPKIRRSEAQVRQGGA